MKDSGDWEWKYKYIFVCVCVCVYQFFLEDDSYYVRYSVMSNSL